MNILKSLQLSWKKKLFIYFLLASLIPLSIASYNIIKLSEDELKSNTNTELINLTGAISKDINQFYLNNWLAYLKIIKLTLENPDLSAETKTYQVINSMKTVDDFLNLDIVFEAEENQFIKAVELSREDFKAAIEKKKISDPFRLNEEFTINKLKAGKKIFSNPVYIDEFNIWVVAALLKLENNEQQTSYLRAIIKIDKLFDRLKENPFNKRGKVFLLDSDGVQVPEHNESHKGLCEDVKALLNTGKRIEGIINYKNSSGEKYISSCSISENINLAIIAVIKQEDAYAAVNAMKSSTIYWGLLGLAISLAGVFLYAGSISRPVTKISKMAQEISKGNFDVEGDFRNSDSIGILGNTLISTSRELKSSFSKIEQQKKELEEYSKSLEDKVNERTFQLKKLNSNLLAANKRLEDLNEEKDEILRIAAHDMKNPLAGIKNFASWIADNQNLPKSEIDNSARIIVDSSQRMFEIINKILEANKLEKEGIPFEIKNVDLVKAIERVISENKMYSSEKKIEVVFNKLETECIVSADEKLLQSILDNLLSNALKFSAKEKVVKIEISQSKKNGSFSIADEGPGFTEDDKSKVFRKFGKLSARPTGGENSTGLGLSIVKKLTELMKGKVTFKSEFGKGTTFTVELPRGKN